MGFGGSLLTTSLQCDRGLHADCTGAAVYMEQDGPQRYVCHCGCHPRQVTEQCSTCGGRGTVTTTRPPVIEKVNRKSRA